MIVRHFYGRPGFGYRGPGPFRVLILVVLLALLVVAIIRLVQMRRYGAHLGRRGSQHWQTGHWGPHSGGDPALHELRLRYARGELSRDEFLERSRDLGAPGGMDGSPPR